MVIRIQLQSLDDLSAEHINEYDMKFSETLSWFAGSYWQVGKWYYLCWFKSKNNRSTTESLVNWFF